VLNQQVVTAPQQALRIAPSPHINRAGQRLEGHTEAPDPSIWAGRRSDRKAGGSWELGSRRDMRTPMPSRDRRTWRGRRFDRSDSTVPAEDNRHVRVGVVSSGSQGGMGSKGVTDKHV